MLDRLKRRFAGRSFLKSVAALSGGAAAGQAIVLLALPIVTRLYDPQAFGLLGLFTATLMVSMVLACLRFELAVPLPRRDRTAANIVALCLLVLGLTTASFAALTAAIGPALAASANVPELAPYLWLFPLGFFVIGGYQVFNQWAVRKGRFGRIAATRITQGAGSVAVQIGLGLMHAGPVGLLLGNVVGQGAGLTALARGAWRDGRDGFRRVSLRAMRVVAARYRRFPLFSTVSGLLNAAGQTHLPNILFTMLYGLAFGGGLLLAQRAIALPMTMIGTAISQAWVNRLVTTRDDPSVDMAESLRTILLRLAVVSAVGFGTVALVAPSVFPIVFGAEWRQAGEIVRVLSLMYMAQFCVSPLAQTLNVLERQDRLLFWDGLRLIAVVGAIWLGYRWRLSGLEAVLLYAAVQVACYLLLAALIILTVSEARRSPRLASG